MTIVQALGAHIRFLVCYSTVVYPVPMCSAQLTNVQNVVRETERGGRKMGPTEERHYEFPKQNLYFLARTFCCPSTSDHVDDRLMVTILGLGTCYLCH